jgi:predicted alpha/beta superfamily hydrolase
MKHLFVKMVVIVFIMITTVANALDPLPEYLVETHYPLGNARIFEFQSEKAGRKYQILLSLPGSYESSGPETRYPVHYVVDGQWHFSIVGAVVGGLYYDRGAREAIVVGITWDGDEAEANRLRVQDFTPTSDGSNPGSGKADKYLDFLQHELIPYVTEHYRASEERTIIGSSYGGLVSLYCLFTRPTLFTDYLASTPATGWDNGVIRKYKDAFKDKDLESPVSLYISRGEMESSRHEIGLFVEEMQAASFKNLEFDHDTIKGAGHGGVNPEAFTRGLQFMFKNSHPRKDDKELLAYAGLYKGQPGWPEILVSVKDGRLYSQDSSNKTDAQWVAVGENLFYITNTGTEAFFSMDDSQQVPQLNLKAESGVFSFKRHDVAVVSEVTSKKVD